MLQALLNLFKTKPVSDQELLAAYKDAGGHYGDACSYAMMGSIVGMKEIHSRWAKLEREYAARGYEPVPIQRFIEYGGYGQSIDDVLDVKLDGEDPTLYDPKPPVKIKIEKLVRKDCGTCFREMTDEDKVFCPRCLRNLLKPVKV